MQPSIQESPSQVHAVVAAESLSAMVRKERTTYRSRDYLRPTRDTVVTECDRLEIVDWCYGIVGQLKLERETVAVAMELVDRFLSQPSDIVTKALRDRWEYQLVAVAALYLSIKTNERVVLGSEFFAILSRGSYTVEDIEFMELNILQGLSWRVCAPTALQVAYRVLARALPCANFSESTTGVILDEVRFQTEFAVRDYFFVTQRPSTIALAAIFNALKQVDQRDRREVLCSLVCIVDEEFATPDILSAAKDRLQSLVEGNNAIAEEDTVASEFGTIHAFSEDGTVVSECSTVQA